MNKNEFEATLATLQAQLDAADRVLMDAKTALSAATANRSLAAEDLRGHISYGKHRGWIERRKRAKKEPVAEAAE